LNWNLNFSIFLAEPAQNLQQIISEPKHKVASKSALSDNTDPIGTHPGATPPAAPPKTYIGNGAICIFLSIES
jgi:hypothetical protein